MTSAIESGPDESGPQPDGLDVVRLGSWLGRVVAGGLAGGLTSKLIAGGRSNPTYEVTDGERFWVIRRPPHGHVLPTAHDMGREYCVLDALRGSAIPVPRVLAMCVDESVLGAPFYAMDKLEGVALRTQEDTAKLSEGDRERLAESMVRTLVALHEIDPADVGLADWGRPNGYLERQLNRWSRQWEASATRRRDEVAELLRRLSATLPMRPQPGIVHGDFKVDNIMVDRNDPDRDRPGAAAVPAGGEDDRRARQQGRGRLRVGGEGLGPSGGAGGDRPRDPGPRRGRGQRRRPPLRRCTDGIAPCASSTARTRCTCARSPRPNSARTRRRGSDVNAHALTVAELAASAGRDLGVSDWLVVEQPRVDQFADATDDHQWIHVDPARAATGPFGRTVAHGYLTLSLVPRLLEDLLVVSDQVRGTNYGLERVRFTNPVPVGSAIRLAAELVEARYREDGGVQYKVGLRVEIRGHDRPAMVGESIFLAYAA